MAVLSQCFSYYCCMESLGKLPPIRFGHHMADVSAILRIFSGAGRRRIQAAAATPTHGEQAGPGTGNAGNGSPTTLPVFFFFWEGCGDPLLVLPVPSVLFLRSEERRVGKECRSRWSPYH